MHSRSTAPCTSRNSASSPLAADVVPPPIRRARHDHADEAIIEAVFHADERGGDFNERGFVRLQLAGDDLLQPLRLAHHAGAQLAETEHAERVADLPEHLDLRAELLRLARATAHEDIEDVFDLAEILADRGGHGLHQLDAGRGEVLALLLHRLIDRQQLGQAERRAHGADARARRFGPTDVIKKVVQQLDRRRLRVARLRPARTAA